MKKKWLIGLLAILGIILILLILLPIVLKPRIEALLVSRIDEQLEARFTVEEVSLSILRSFPNASVRMDNPRLITRAPFEGDTLFSAESAGLALSLRELFRRGEGPRKIKSFEIDHAVLNLVIDEAGRANYDIIKEGPESADTDNEADARVFDLESYEIRNTTVRYTDLESGISFAAEGIEHKGQGELSARQSELQTESTARLSLATAETKWLTEIPVRLQAVLGIDLDTDTYTFKQNRAFLRELPLTLSGSLKFLEEGQQWDFSLATPDSDFRNALALIPEKYSSIEKEFTASGAFQLSGAIQGLLNEDRIPQFEFRISANDGFLKYTGLPKALEQIQMELRIANESGLTPDTFIEIGNAAFAIGSDQVQLRARIEDLLEKISVNADAQAALDLAQLKSAYPESSWQDLQGRVDGTIRTRFNMQDVRNKQYAHAEASGNLEVSGLSYQEDPAFPAINIENAALEFDPQRTRVSNMKGTIGTSDFALQGTITNLLGYLFEEDEVRGSFNLSSKTLDLNEFLVTQNGIDEDEGSTEEKFEIPGFLNATIKAEAATVYYDDLVLNDVNGNLIIRDKAVRLENAQSDFLGGNLLLNGAIDSSKEQPEFALQLALQDNGIAELFRATDLFQKLAPLAQGIQGTMDTRLVINGTLANGFNLDFASLSGQAQTEIKALERILGEASLIRGIQQRLDFLEGSDLDLKGLKTVLKFQDGRVEVSPFDFNYKDIAVRVRGSHTFDAALDYSIAMDVPAYYLGDEVNNLIAQLNDPELEQIPVPVNISLSGNYRTPVIQTDLTKSVATLTSRLVTLQKEKALARGKEEARDLIGGIFGGENDSTEAKQSKPSVGGVLGDVLLGGSNKDSVQDAPDSVTTSSPTLQETATGILGGLLKKKKKDSIPKDTIN